MSHQITTFWLRPVQERAGLTHPILAESGTEMISARVDDRYEVFLRVTGETRVTYKGILYTSPAIFPDTLKKDIRKNGIPSVADLTIDSFPKYTLFVYDDSCRCLMEKNIDVSLPSLDEKSARAFILDHLSRII